MVVNGECVNVFCAVRPPGHHAGKLYLHEVVKKSTYICFFRIAFGYYIRFDHLRIMQGESFDQ